jgi:hypothetical protein
LAAGPTRTVATITSGVSLVSGGARPFGHATTPTAAVFALAVVAA